MNFPVCRGGGSQDKMDDKEYQENIAFGQLG